MCFRFFMIWPIISHIRKWSHAANAQTHFLCGLSSIWSTNWHSFSPNTFCDASFEYSKRFIQFKALMYLCVENNLPVKRVRTCGSRVKRRKSKSVHVNWLHSHGNWPIEALVLAFAHHFSSFDSEQQLH